MLFTVCLSVCIQDNSNSCGQFRPIFLGWQHIRLKDKLCHNMPSPPASWPLTFWPRKWCPSHMWRGLPVCQFGLPRPLNNQYFLQPYFKSLFCMWICLWTSLPHPLSLSLYGVLTAIIPGEPGLAGFTEAKDDGSGGDNWSYKTCEAPVKSSPSTNQHPTLYRPAALPVAQPTVSKHWRYIWRAGMTDDWPAWVDVPDTDRVIKWASDEMRASRVKTQSDNLRRVTLTCTTQLYTSTDQPLTLKHTLTLGFYLCRLSLQCFDRNGIGPGKIWRQQSTKVRLRTTYWRPGLTWSYLWKYRLDIQQP